MLQVEVCGEHAIEVAVLIVHHPVHYFPPKVAVKLDALHRGRETKGSALQRSLGDS
jgi:hypothetical protein